MDPIEAGLRGRIPRLNGSVSRAPSQLVVKLIEMAAMQLKAEDHCRCFGPSDSAARQTDLLRMTMIRPATASHHREIAVVASHSRQ